MYVCAWAEGIASRRDSRPRGVIIMSLKRVTSGTRGPSSNTEYPPPSLLCPLRQWQSTLIPQQSAHRSHGSEAREGVACRRWEGGGGTGGGHQEMDRECFEWETCLHSSRSTWVSALHEWSKRHSEDGRDETRTGGGLSFSEEWSSPRRSGEAVRRTPSQQDPQPTGLHGGRACIPKAQHVFLYSSGLTYSYWQL